MASSRFLRLHASDNVIVAVDAVDLGAAAAEGVSARTRIPKGHKMATAAVPKSAPIVKFGQIIGFASRDIAPGEWVHEHNVEMHDFTRDYRFGEEARPTAFVGQGQQATFEGYKRPNGKVGTRNYVAILTSVNCSASVARFMAKEVERSGITRTSTASFRSFTARAAASPPRARVSRRSSAPNGATPRTRTSPRSCSSASAAKSSRSDA
jgi:altronate hydrolase